MVTPRVTRALNPQRKRKLSLKQIRAGFGGKRRQASLRGSNRHSHKRRAAATNPKPKKRKQRAAKAKNAMRTKVVYRTKYKTRTKKVYVAAPKKRRRKANAKRRRKSSNPGPYLATFVPVGNPHRKRRKSVAKHRRKVSAKGRSGKRRNPTRRRSVARRRGHHRSRNPIIATSTLKTGFGVFIGFSAAKKIPPMFGPQMNSSPMMTLLSTAITAGVVAWAAQRFVPGPFADGALWGGVGGVINVAWNAWAPPSIASYAGVGDFVAGGFPLPQGPVRSPLALPGLAPNGSQVDVGAFGQAFTRAW